METVTPARKGLGASTSPQGSAQWTQSSDTPTEVYDIGHDSEDDVGPISSAVRSLNVDGALPPEPRLGERRVGSSWMPWTVERSPDSAVDGSTAPSSMSKAPTSRAKEADVWTVEDWDKQLQRLKEAPTPCRVPEGADAKQKQVADAVREELQVDLEALVNAAMDEMRSWVSQEIAFARSSFEEAPWRVNGGVRTVSVTGAVKPAPVQEMKRALEEQRQMLDKMQEIWPWARIYEPLVRQLVPSMCEEKVNPSDPRDLDEPAAGECERRPSARQEVPGQSLFQRGKAVLEL
ncbi:unnamed protein product [Durusdinium trenchii]|uniref:Uncharacterized protein n=1 Tax=Durusdinium trenchii TaxID=1381693 RepID=A0ABP0NTZ5_9DINO